MENKGTLRYFKEKLKLERETFYDGSWEGKLLFKARSDSLELNGRIGDWRGIPTNCTKCGEERETLEHLLLECEWYEEERIYLENKIKELENG